MKKFLLFFLTCCLYLSVSAQRVYFIYFESDARPFYLKMGENVYSSAASGYLLLSDLKDSSYTFSIGFPSGNPKETRFQVSIQGADRGFSIKNMEGKLHLFDLQSLNLIKPVQDPMAANIQYETRSDQFTSLLARASGDSSLLLVPIVAKAEMKPKEEKKEKAVNSEETKPLTVGATAGTGEVKPKSEEVKTPVDLTAAQPDKPTIKADSVKQTTEPASASLATGKEEKEQNTAQLSSSPDTATTITTKVVDSTTAIQPVEEYRKSTVKRYSESSTSEGFGLVFLDHEGELTDTVRLLIPNPKMIIRDRDTTQDEKLFLDAKDIKVDTVQQASMASQPAATPQQPLKSQCQKQASDNDFFKLRKNMVVRESDESMVEEAKKYFKTRCFTTEQIKNLSALFLSSAGKYQFFDAAFLHVSDQEHFSSLQSEIKDDYYLRRFKALIGE